MKSGWFHLLRIPTIKDNNLYTNYLTILSGNGLFQIIGFIYNILLIRVLLPEIYGVVIIASSMLGILGSFTNLNTSLSLIRFSKSEWSDSSEEFKAYYSSALIIELFAWIILLTLTAIHWLLNLKLCSPPILIILAFISIFDKITELYLSRYTIYQKFRKQAVKRLNFQLIRYLIILMSVYIVSPTVQAFIVASAISSFLIGIFILIKTRNLWGRDNISKAILKNILSYGSGYYITNILKLGYEKLDVVLIGNYISASAAAQYKVAQNFSSIIGQLGSPTGNIILPLAADCHNKNNYSKLKEMSVKITNIYYYLVLALIPLILFFKRDFITLLVGDKYQESAQYFVWLSFISLFVVVTAVYPPIVRVLNIKMSVIATIVASVIGISLNFLLIKRFQIMGAIISNAISIFIGTSILIWYSVRSWRNFYGTIKRNED